MKMLMPAAALLCLAGCADGADVLGIKTPKDVSGFMLSRRPAPQVAECLAGRLGAAARPEGDDYELTSSTQRPVTYRVRTISDPRDRYTTQVDRFGAIASADPTVVDCIVPQR